MWLVIGVGRIILGGILVVIFGSGPITRAIIAFIGVMLVFGFLLSRSDQY